MAGARLFVWIVALGICGSSALAKEKTMRFFGTFGGFRYSKITVEIDDGEDYKQTNTVFGTFCNPGLGFATMLMKEFELGGILNFRYSSSKSEVEGGDDGNEQSTTTFGARVFLDYYLLQNPSWWLGVGAFVEISKTSIDYGGGDTSYKEFYGGPLVGLRLFLHEHFSIDFDALLSFGKGYPEEGEGAKEIAFALVVGFSGWL